MYEFENNHWVVNGCGLAARNLTSWYRDELSAIQGTGTMGKHRGIDGLALLSGLLLMLAGSIGSLTID